MAASRCPWPQLIRCVKCVCLSQINNSGSSPGGRTGTVMYKLVILLAVTREYVTLESNVFTQ